MAGESKGSKVRAFVNALRELEEERNAEPLAALFADDATLFNPHIRRLNGTQNVQHFWKTYRLTFGTVHSEFRHVLETDECAMLEWKSTGTGPTGRAFRYDGVSVLEFEGDRIKTFRTYFDPQLLADQLQLGSVRPNTAKEGEQPPAH